MTHFHTPLFLTILLLGTTGAKADILIDINPNLVNIVEGTTSVSFDIVLSQTANEAFNGFTLAFGVGDGGTVLGMPQDGDNLLFTGFSTIGGILEGTDFTSIISAGGIGQSAMLINFVRAPGNTDLLPASGTLASFTLDTSGTVTGQSFQLNPNIGGLSAASDGAGSSIPLMPPTMSRFLNITAANSADFDQDLDVDGADFLLWQRGGSPNLLSSSDLTNWENDFGNSNFGNSANLSSVARTIPEPATGVLLLLAGILGIYWQRVNPL